jgi:hypothetical protein
VRYATIDFDACEKETGSAVLLRIDEDPHWVPKSMFSEDGWPEEGSGAGSADVEEWWATKEGLT